MTIVTKQVYGVAPFADGVAVPADLYLDPAAGLDANLGGSGAPLQTFAQAKTMVQSGQAIAVNGYVRETGPLRTSAVFLNRTGVKLRNAGDGLLSGTVKVAAWTLDAGNVYKATVAVEDPSTSWRSMCMEDGRLLRRVANKTDLTGPGKYWQANGGAMTGATIDTYIWPTGSGNPNSNGKTYEVTARAFGVATNVAGIGVDDLTFHGYGNNGGGLEIGARGNVRRARILCSTKHAFLMQGGVGENIRAWDFDLTTTAEPNSTMGVFYSDAGGGVLSLRDVQVWAKNWEEWSVNPSPLTGIYAHTASLGVGQKYLYIDGLVVRWSGIGVSGDIETLLCRNASFQLVNTMCAANSMAASSHTFENFQTLIGAFTDKATFAKTAVLRNGLIVSTATQEPVSAFAMDGGNTTIENVTWYAVASDLRPASTNFGRPFLDTNSGNPALTVNRSVIFGCPAFGNQLNIANAGTYVGDYNIFCRHRPIIGSSFGATHQICSAYHGTQYENLAAWQTATGQDAHSVYLAEGAQTQNFFVGDPTTGDWMINPKAQVTGADGTVYTGCFPDGTPLTKAGVQGQVPRTWQPIEAPLSVNLRAGF